MSIYLYIVYLLLLIYVQAAFLHSRNSRPNRLIPFVYRNTFNVLNVPSFTPYISRNSNADAPSPFPTSGAPSPSSSLTDRQLIPPEGKPGAHNPNKRAKNNVEAMVVELEVSSAGDVDCDRDWNKWEDEEVRGRCGGLIAHGDELIRD